MSHWLHQLKHHILLHARHTPRNGGWPYIYLWMYIYPQDKRLELNPVLASSKFSVGYLTFCLSLFLLLCNEVIPLCFI